MGNWALHCTCHEATRETASTRIGVDRVSRRPPSRRLRVASAPWVLSLKSAQEIVRVETSSHPCPGASSLFQMQRMVERVSVRVNFHWRAPHPPLSHNGAREPLAQISASGQ